MVYAQVMGSAMHDPVSDSVHPCKVLLYVFPMFFNCLPDRGGSSDFVIEFGYSRSKERRFGATIFQIRPKIWIPDDLKQGCFLPGKFSFGVKNLSYGWIILHLQSVQIFNQIAQQSSWVIIADTHILQGTFHGVAWQFKTPSAPHSR